MPKQIQDEFTALPISAQRRWQLRRQRDGRCRICGGQVMAEGAVLCKRHAAQAVKLRKKAARRRPVAPTVSTGGAWDLV